MNASTDDNDDDDDDDDDDEGYHDHALRGNDTRDYYTVMLRKPACSCSSITTGGR